MLVGSLVFIVLGICLVVAPEYFQTQSRTLRDGPNSIPGIMLLGIIGAVFFGACAIFTSRKVFDTRPGLIIDDLGITDNSSAVAVGRVFWHDVTDVESFEMYGRRHAGPISKFVILRVKKPQRYLDQQMAFLKRQAMQTNFKMCGTPVTITSNTLKITHQDLYTLLRRKHAEYLGSRTAGIAIGRTSHNSLKR